MEQRSTLRLMAAVGIGLVVVAIIAVIRVFQFNQALPPEAWQKYSGDAAAQDAAALAVARERWKAHEVSHYELVIDRKFTSAGGQAATCTQDIEVRGGKVQTTIQDTCQNQPGSDSPAGGGPFELSIAGLFDQITHDTQEITWSRQGIGCTYLALDVAYDQDWGYPHRIAYRWEAPPPELGHPIDRRYFLPGTATPSGACQMLGLADGPELAITLNVLP